MRKLIAKKKTVISSGDAASWKPRKVARRWRKPLLFALALMGVGSISVAVYAISSELPEPADDGSLPSLVIGRMAGGSTLPADQTTIKLIYDARPDFVEIFDGAWCQTSQYDHQETAAPADCTVPDPEGEVFYDFEALNNDTGAVGPRLTVRASTMARNGGINGNYRVNLNPLAQKIQSTDGKWFVKLTVRWELQNPASCTPQSPISSTCRTGSNFFRVIMPRTTDLATYAVVNGQSDPLTVENDGPGSPKFSDMTFFFAPPCTASGNALVQPLRWQDADAKQSNQDGPISWELIDESAQGGARVIAFAGDDEVGGQGESGQYPAGGGGITFQTGHKYRWVWKGVDRDNGVQLFFPFDSYNYERDCGTVSLDKTSNAPGDLGPGDTFDYFIDVSRVGGAVATLSVVDDLPASLAYVPDPVFNQPPPSGISNGGQRLTWNFAAGSPQINALNSSGSFLIRFKVQVRVGAQPGAIQNSVSGTATNPGGNPVPVNPDTTTVPLVAPDPSQRAYFKVNGGDVKAGVGMDLGAVDCDVAADDKAGIVSWNRGQGYDYYGAGTQFAALIGSREGRLQDFATAQSDRNMAPDALSFANSNPPNGLVNTAAGHYGGQFQGGECVPDYLKDAPPIAPGDLVLNATVVANGDRQVRYVRGDVYITGNITYSGNYGTLNDMPSFKVITQGNIYIAPGVRQLDGLYIAQPSTRTSDDGKIFTCATTGPVNSGNLNLNLYSSCNTPLTVNGAFSARQVWLMRTFGALDGPAAETFNFTPEIWLTGLGGGSMSGRIEEYDAITSLPPVL